MIELEDLRQLLKQHRWTLNTRKSGKQQVFVAKQRRGPKLATFYIATERTLQSLTEADIVGKIRKAAERLAQQRDGHDQAHTEQNQPNRAYMPALSIIPAFTTELKRKEA